MNMSDALEKSIYAAIKVTADDERYNTEYKKGKIDAYLDILDMCNVLDRKDFDNMVKAMRGDDK